MTSYSATGATKPLPVGRTLALCLLVALPVMAEQPDSLVYALTAPSSGFQSGAGLGHSVAVDGGYAVAGAPFDDMGAQDSGVAKVFDSSTGALLYVIPNPIPAVYDNFGFSVAISGSRVVVGAHRAKTGEIDAGTAYVYDLASATPTKPVATLLNPNTVWGGNFGRTVAISGTRVVVGAPGNELGAGEIGRAHVYDLASTTPALPVATLHHPSPMPQDRFGFSVAISDTRVVVGAPGDDAGADNAGSAHVYDLAGESPLTPVATLLNPSPSGWDQFGDSVAISGTRIVVGASWDDTDEIDAGSAHVYDLASETPTTPVASLLNPDPLSQGQFGIAAALSGSVIVVGARLSSATTVPNGTAYVYDLSSTTPATPVVTLRDPGPSVGGGFGNSVAIAGTRVVVGAPWDDTGGYGAGSAYAYELASMTPTVPGATLRHPGPSAGDLFGNSVAIANTKIVVGVPRDTTGAAGAGSACVYDLGGGTPTIPMTVLHNPRPSGGDVFGDSVAISGTWVVVGAPGDDTSGFGAGTTYVYDLTGATPTLPMATLLHPSPLPQDRFGSSVAISGTRIVVGAPEMDAGAVDAGSAYVYDLASETPTTPVTTLLNPSPSGWDRFGSSVSISGTWIVIGAPGDDTGVAGAGSAYLYDLSSATPATPVVALHHPAPSGWDRFGSSVAIAGARVVVGAPADDTGAENTGAAYVYDVTSSTPTLPAATLLHPSPLPIDLFGSSVAISGTRVVVGAPERDTGAIDAGTTYVFDLASGTPTTPVATLQNPGPTPYDWFGTSVAIAGTRVVVGTPGDASPQAAKGSAYIFGPGGPASDDDGDGLRDVWELTYWPTTSGQGPMDDNDNDGYGELLELALGLNPMVPNLGGIPEVTHEGGYLTMTIARQPGASYEVQTAGTLFTGEPGSFSAASTTILIDNATTLKVRDNFNRATAPDRLIRLKVTAAP